MKRLSLCACLLLVPAIAFAQSQSRGDGAAPPASATEMESLVRNYLWPASDSDFQSAKARLSSDASLVGVSRITFEDFEEVVRQGRSHYPNPPALVNGHYPLQQLSFAVPGGAKIPVLVQLPDSYRPDIPSPLLWAMHGGPPNSVAQAQAGAGRMIKVWQVAQAAGWIVAAPALVTSISQGTRTKERLPFEVLHPEQARALFEALRATYNIDPDRIVSTGISLGSNFSLIFGCSHPDWLAAIVPVSTEGDSRPQLLRNLEDLPVYILEGSLDKNIRTVTGPRTLAAIVDGLGFDLNYREFPNHVHESFQPHYPDVLRWLTERPRVNFPRELVRSPNSSITPVGRRRYWIEADTRQALVRARVDSPTRIDITVRWARTLKVYLSDRLVDMDKPIEIWVNGVRAFTGQVPRSIPTALEQARALGDEGRIYAAVVDVRVPQTPKAIAAGRQLADEWDVDAPQNVFSYWETYAGRALEERFPDVGFQGVETNAPSGAGLVGEETAIRVTQVAAGSSVQAAGLRSGDLVLEVGGEPFYRGHGGVAGLHTWLMHELRGQPKQYSILIWRNGQRSTLTAQFQLGPYATASSSAAGELF